MKQDELKVEYGQIPKVLLLGNGINRAYDFASWDDLIESIRTKELTTAEKESMGNVPYPLQPVILTNDHLGTQMKGISGALSELRTTLEEEKILRKFAALPVDAILTANYTYELEKALDSNFRCSPGRRCKARKTAYDEGGKYIAEQLHTYFAPQDDVPPIWHIHGEASRPNTMVLGHYYYGKLLAKMQQYVSSFMARYRARASRQQNMEMRSWLDYFLMGEVYIVGLGMALSEMDLWWLVNCKKRHFPDSKVILYKPDIKPEEKMLAEAYGVIVNSNGFTGDYKDYYSWLCTELEKTL